MGKSREFDTPIFSEGLKQRKNFKDSKYLNNTVETLDPNDLSNLKYIKPKKVKQLVKHINSLTEEDIKGKEIVIGIGTGGTIAMKKNPKTGLLEPDLDFNSILKQASNRLEKDYLFKGLDAMRIDSSQMTPEYIADITLSIVYTNNHINKDISGFIVLHGTDTMVSSASRTAMQLGDGFDESIVYTGAQKPMVYKREDASDNIVNALHTVTAANKNNITETIISFGRKAMIAVGAVKSSGIYSDAFSSPMHKYVMDHGKLTEPDDIILDDFLRRKNAAKVFDPRITRESSNTIFIPADMYNNPKDIFHHIMDKSPHMVVLETYGADTACKSVVEAVSGACNNLVIPGFTVSSVDELPGTATYASSDMIIKAGLIPMNMLMHTAKAKTDRIKSFTDIPLEPNLVKWLMTKDFINEIPNSQSLKGNEV